MNPSIFRLLVLSAFLAITVLGPRIPGAETPRAAETTSPSVSDVVYGYGLQGCNGTTNGSQVVNNLEPAGACILAALESGQIDFTNPTQAVLQIAKICVGATAEAIFNTLTALLNGAVDGGLGAVPLAGRLAQITAIRDAAGKLHGTYAEMVAAGVGK